MLSVTSAFLCVCFKDAEVFSESFYLWLEYRSDPGQVRARLHSLMLISLSSSRSPPEREGKLVLALAWLCLFLSWQLILTKWSSKWSQMNTVSLLQIYLFILCMLLFAVSRVFGPVLPLVLCFRFSLFFPRPSFPLRLFVLRVAEGMCWVHGFNVRWMTRLRDNRLTSWGRGVRNWQRNGKKVQLVPRN